MLRCDFMHAYMIIAHNQFDLLEKLVKSLDDKRNDIYIHIDKKVKIFDFERIKNAVKYSSVYFTNTRYSIKWASFDMVKAEYALLEKVFENGKRYDYVHLLSGVDLPVKSNDYIHSFFDKNSGKEFVHFTHKKLNSHEIDRVKAYHFAMGRRNYFNRLITYFESKLANILKINRIKNLEVQKGSQWFSITGEFAEYILAQKDFVSKQFKHTFIPDEFFVQTLLINSKFKNNLYMNEFDDNHEACVRLIDWKRGNPYVWRTEDFEEIKNSPCIFARKFDLNTDKEIVEKIIDKLL